MKLTVLGVDPSPLFPGFVVARVDSKQPTKTFGPTAWSCIRPGPIDRKTRLSMPKVYRYAERATEWCIDAMRRVDYPKRKIVAFEEFYPATHKGGKFFMAYVSILYANLWREFGGDIVLAPTSLYRPWLCQELTGKRKAQTKEETIALVDRIYRGSKELGHPVPEALENGVGLKSEAYRKYEAIRDATAVALYGAHLAGQFSHQYWRSAQRNPLGVKLDA